MHDFANDQDFGFSPSERKAEICNLVFKSVLTLIFLVNYSFVLYVASTMNYKVRADDGTHQDEFMFDSIFNLMLIILGYDIVLLIRIILKIYMICMWRNKNIDPTLV